MKPYCPCEACQQRTAERLRNADAEDLKKMIAVLQAHRTERNTQKGKP
jgi:hypothetical protein